MKLEKIKTIAITGASSYIGKNLIRLCLENDIKVKAFCRDIKKFDKNFLNNKNLSKIKKAQKNALIKTFKQKKIPYREIKIKKINEETLGELFSYFILETAILGKLSKIDPFNQPAVQAVKIRTKQNLT